MTSPIPTYPIPFMTTVVYDDAQKMNLTDTEEEERPKPSSTLLPSFFSFETL